MARNAETAAMVSDTGTGRRSSQAVGFVRFPVDDPRWESTGEGGLFVRLVVMPPTDGRWGVASGGEVFVVRDEVFLGDDNRVLESQWRGGAVTLADLEAERKAGEEYGSYHFPRHAEAREIGGLERDLSVPYLCAMVIGSTGWSGCSKIGSYWRCSVDDLTEEGRALYESLEKLYPGCRIHLQTWLDT